MTATPIDKNPTPPLSAVDAYSKSSGVQPRSKNRNARSDETGADEAKANRTNAMLTRRSAIIGALALPLTACSGGETATVRFKVIASATVDGRPVESSSVMEVTYSKVTQSLVGNGGATRLYGEALIFDLGGKGTVYILPIQHAPNASLTQVYEYGVLTTFGINSSIGSLSKADFLTLSNATGRRPFRLHSTTRLPAFVSFTNEADPKTIFEILPSELGRYFPGVRFTGLDVEVTDAPITKELRDRLPWLKSTSNSEIFPRDPRGARRPNSELPLSHMITRARFFGDGSR
ncbi:hypothetical protein ACCS68_36270 [Rhizobium beringeri]|uniref:hypothetical protein n=1 Tax=Rhizobium TaxID=379 RepID=UPI0019801AA8|nr:hypothetical protein [Rhizobium leguminosarum]